MMHPRTPWMTRRHPAAVALVAGLALSAVKPAAVLADGAPSAAPSLPDAAARVPEGVPAPGWPHAPDAPATRAQIDALIDRLTQIAEEDGDLTGRLAPVDDLEPADPDDPASRPPHVSPALKAVVALGARALPALIDHLTDPRPTRAVVSSGGRFSVSLLFSNEFDARAYDRDPSPAGTLYNVGHPFAAASSYTLTVGDVCYLAIGQIVARRYYPARYQPTAVMLIDSPVKVPALAAAAREEWVGISPEEYRRSLLAAINSPGNFGNGLSALRQLCYYYPGEGERAAIALIGRPIWDEQPTNDYPAESPGGAAGSRNAMHLQDAPYLLAPIRPFRSPALAAAVDRLMVEVTSRLLSLQGAVSGHPREWNEDRECGLGCAAYLDRQGYRDDRRALYQACIALVTEERGDAVSKGDTDNDWADDELRHLRDDMRTLR